MSSRTRVVICGGGAIGAAIAYFTSRRGARSTVIERHEVGGAASGKSGGFLALDWCRGSSLDRLARRSFELHAELSAELGDPWGYRRLTTYGGYAVEGDSACGARGRPWLADGVAITSRLGSPQTTALVEPRAFTRGLMHAAQAHGYGRRPGAQRKRSRARRSTRQRRDRRRRRRRHRHGTVVDPGGALAAAASGLWLQGPQLGVRNRWAYSRGSSVPRVPRGERGNSDPRVVSARRRHDMGVCGINPRTAARRSCRRCT